MNPDAYRDAGAPAEICSKEAGSALKLEVECSLIEC